MPRPETSPAPPPAFETRAGAYALVLQDDAVLLTAWRGPDGLRWTLPGGGIELGESPEQACVREVLEETGFSAELTGLLGVTTGDVPAARRLGHKELPLLTVQVYFGARLTGGTLCPEAEGSTVDARWFPLAEVPSLPTVWWVTSALALAGVALPGGGRTA
ncbi:NUDIX hydrolase [Micrococcus sp.]|uniref:NUDIX hydrolase n=1 Tax=Micrococcus sp. TaxID=1271 RepID=UPI002A9159FE|nr:NUDIX domain-containing protein [Micrococcus sp.]MDY6055810.1 NUDIX domain-containing protein [Micrococcus sp.]